MAGPDRRGGIGPSYVSPTLRMAFAKEDFPTLHYVSEVLTVEEAGIHPLFQGNVKHVVQVTLHIPGQEPVQAWKEVDPPKRGESLTPQDFVVLETKALGRAFKRAGYPDDMEEFRALILWRRRAKEIAQIAAATPQVSALATPAEPVIGEIAGAVERAARADADDEPVYDGDDSVVEPEPMTAVDDLPSGIGDRVRVLPVDIAERFRRFHADRPGASERILLAFLASLETDAERRRAAQDEVVVVDADEVTVVVDEAEAEVEAPPGRLV